MMFKALGGVARRHTSSTRRRVTSVVPQPLENLEAREVPAAGAFGMNLNTLDFVDVMKEPSQGWSPIGQPSLALDSHGWPTSDASILIYDWRVNQPWNGPDPNAVQPDFGGTYHLSFHGQATIQPNWLQNFTVQNQTYDARTNVTNADLVVAHYGYAMLQVSFSNTRNVESPTGAGVSNVQMLQPGYAAGTTQLFTDDFLNALKPAGTLRYMDVTATNFYGPDNSNDAPLDWSQRRLPSDASQAVVANGKGAAWEYLIALANTTNTDMWINVPGTATDDYVAQLARLFRDGDTVDGVTYAGLKPNLKVYLEYSNEVWGGIANTADSNKRAAQAEVAAGNSTLNNDGTTDVNAWAARRDLKRTMEITNAFRSALGADPAYARVRPVLGVQETNYPGVQALMNWFQASYGAPSQYFYGIGDAIYWGPTDTSSPDAIINSLIANEATSAQYMQKFTTVTDYYGLKYVSYEGGPGMGGTGQVALNMLAASRDPRMEAVVAQHYLDFYAAGGDIAAIYNGPYTIWSPNYGLYSLAELSQRHAPSLSAKFRAAQDIAAAPPQASTYGLPVAATAPTSLPIAADSLGRSFVRGTTADTLFWTLNVASAGAYRLTLTTVNGNPNNGTAPGIIQVVAANQQVLGTYTISSNGTFDLGAIPLAAGRNTLAIKVIRGSFDPSSSNYYLYGFWPASLTLTPPTGTGTGTGTGTDPVVLDSGFEAVSVGGYWYNAPGSAWSFAGSSGLTLPGTGGFGTPGAVAPGGKQVAFLQTTGSFSQSVQGWSAGSYAVTFQAAQRGTYGPNQQDFQVLVDGAVVGTFRPGSSSYQGYATASFAVSAGSHTVAFRGLDSVGGDNTAMIDEVKVSAAVPATPPAVPAVLDSGFEAVSVGGYWYNAPGSAWSFAGSSGLTLPGTGGFGTPGAVAPGGKQVAFLQTTGSFSQSVQGWSAGSYAVTFQAAQRGTYGPNQQDFQVLVDGAVVGTFRPGSSSYQGYTTASFAVSAGSHTVTFRGLDSVGGDNTAMIDEVKVVAASAASAPPVAPVAPAAPAAADAGFETVTVGGSGYWYNAPGSAWSFAGSSGLTLPGTGGFGTPGAVAPGGKQVAFLQTTGSFSQSVQGWSAGSYAVTFQAAQRGTYGLNQQDFQVLVDGAVVGTFRPGSSSYQGYTTASFAVSAGSHTVTFRGLDSVGGDNTAMIDEVKIVAG